MTIPPRSTTDWPLVWLLVLVGFAVAALVGKVPPSLPAIRGELDMSLRTAGWFVSLVNLMTALAGTLVALAGDRIGHRRLVAAGLAAGALASAGGAMTASAATLFVCRGIEGLSFLAVAVSVPSLILRVSTAGDTRQAMALWGIYLPGGAGLMALASAGLLPTWGWRGVWWTSAAVLVLAALALLRSSAGRGANAVASSGGRSLGRDMVEAASSPGPLAIGACFGFYSVSWFSMIGFLP
ncbi:MAG: MFS transporter, partial [Alphaproteobacteria bacterium]|nr:MFS transporter [Alphaproteobacteria bacterium]